VENDTDQPFSISQGFRSEPPLLNHDVLPDWVRDEVHRLINRLAIRWPGNKKEFDDRLSEELRPFHRRIYGRNSEQEIKDTRAWSELKLMTSEIAISFSQYEGRWFDAYDIWQVIYRMFEDIYDVTLDGNPMGVGDEFNVEVNKLFEEAGVIWRMNGAKFERVRDPATEGIIRSAMTILRQPQYAGPSEQYGKALEHLNRMPEPDTQNSVKDAVGALEGMARIVTNEPKKTLGAILNDEPLKSTISPLILKALRNVWGYRSDEPGIGHGQVESSSVGVEEAEWVLGVCASSMVYFSNRFPVE